MEIAVTVLCLWATLAALRSTSLSRRDWGMLGSVTALALVARAAVPWVPANFYTDYLEPQENYSYNDAYRAPLHLSLRALHLPGTSILAADVLIGVLTVATFHVGMLRIHRSGGERWFSGSAIWIFSALVAVSPAFVRIAASDAPHVVGLGWFAAAIVVLGAFVCNGEPWAVAAVAGACWMVGAARRELATLPLTLCALVWIVDCSKQRKVAATTAIFCGSLLGAELTTVALSGRANAEIAFRWAWLAGYARQFPTALFASFGHVPLAIPFGIWSMAVGSVVMRRGRTLVAYAILLFIATAHYSASVFAMTLDHPLESWALARYAQGWLVVQTWFAAIGLATLWDVIRRRGAFPSVTAGLALGASCLSGTLWMFRLHGYQNEFRFLERELPNAPIELPVVAVWQKNAGIDYCEALAVPHYVYSSLERKSIVLPTTTSLGRMIGELPPQFVYFRNTLADVDLSKMGNLPTETTDGLRQAQAADCALRRGRKLAVWKDVPVQYIQLPVRDQRETLELWIVDRDAASSAWKECSATR